MQCGWGLPDGPPVSEVDLTRLSSKTCDSDPNAVISETGSEVKMTFELPADAPPPAQEKGCVCVCTRAHKAAAVILSLCVNANANAGGSFHFGLTHRHYN